MEKFVKKNRQSLDLAEKSFPFDELKKKLKKVKLTNFSFYRFYKQKT